MNFIDKEYGGNQGFWRAKLNQVNRRLLLMAR